MFFSTRSALEAEYAPDDISEAPKGDLYIVPRPRVEREESLDGSESFTLHLE
jgi:hypothetical protein